MIGGTAPAFILPDNFPPKYIERAFLTFTDGEMEMEELNIFLIFLRAILCKSESN